MSEVIVRKPQSKTLGQWTGLWACLTFAWLIALCVLPDPRPLSAPDGFVAILQKISGVSESIARASATFLLRSFGIALLGLLFSLSLGRFSIRWAALGVLLVGPVVALASLWINYGYFPVFFQAQLCVVSAILGGLAGLALRRTLIGKLTFAITLGLVFVWGISTGITDDVDEAARITGDFVLQHVDDIPQGDPGFTAVVEEAFRFAEENSHRTSAVETNKAVIVALGVILGDETVAKVAHRRLTGKYASEIAAIRKRVTLRDRSDLPRHFWVSAALTVLSDQDRSLTVGITKELMDAEPGGSGFSFVDLMADEAGNLFAAAATKDDDAARLVQRLMRDGTETSDFLPPIDGLPEGLPMETFQEEYGGLGGAKTTEVADDIRNRLKGCRMLYPTLGPRVQ